MGRRELLAGGEAGLLHEGHQRAVQGLGAEQLRYLHLEDQPDKGHHRARDEHALVGHDDRQARRSQLLRRVRVDAAPAAGRSGGPGGGHPR